MNTTILQIPSKTYLVVSEGRDLFEHRFGGSPRHQGTRFKDVGVDLHLLYSFDLADPRLKLRLLGLRTLPIYYAFRNQEGGLCYQVLSDREIVILSKPYEPSVKNTYYNGFPNNFIEKPIRLSEFSYNPHEPDDIVLYASLFGLEGLSVPEKEKIKKKVEAKNTWLLDEYGRPNYATLDELVDDLGGILFPVGHTPKTCPNPRCKNHRSAGKMNFFLHLRPDEADTGSPEKILYQEMAGADSGQMHVELCQSCHSIRVTNPCT